LPANEFATATPVPGTGITNSPRRSCGCKEEEEGAADPDSDVHADVANVCKAAKDIGLELDGFVCLFVSKSVMESEKVRR
jgi:hypothetical protein